MSMGSRVITPFKGQHDHGRCLDDALKTAEEVCAEAGLRLTPLRRQVLELVWRSHTPARAYEILEELKELGHRPAPPTAYRALDFLERAGLIHRIESLNAFVGCADPGARHAGQFFICERCDAIAEISDPSLIDALQEHAERLGFAPRTRTIEVRGTCARCGSETAN
jgi:Fur family zinc uptake transcriptional regulator